MKKDKVYIICVWWIIIDQIIKTIVTMKMKLEEAITIIPNFFRLYYIKNTGAAFSSFTGKKYLLITVGIIVFFYLVHYIKKNSITNKLEIISLGMIMGGIVGNLVDRLLYGAVIDYLSFIIFGYNFAVFNLADIGIVVGIVILIISIIKQNNSDKNKVEKVK